MKHCTARILVYIILLTVLIIGMSLFAQQLLRRDSNRLEAAIVAVEECIGADNWKEAETNLDQVEKIWLDVRATWSSLIDHEEIDNIDVALSRFKTLVRTKEPADSLSEAATLRTYVGHIPRKEKLIPENLF